MRFADRRDVLFWPPRRAFSRRIGGRCVRAEFDAVSSRRRRAERRPNRQSLRSMGARNARRSLQKNRTGRWRRCRRRKNRQATCRWRRPRPRWTTNNNLRRPRLAAANRRRSIPDRLTRRNRCMQRCRNSKPSTNRSRRRNRPFPWTHTRGPGREAPRSPAIASRCTRPNSVPYSNFLRPPKYRTWPRLPRHSATSGRSSSPSKPFPQAGWRRCRCCCWNCRRRPQPRARRPPSKSTETVG